MSFKGGHKIYRRQHEKALAKIVDRIVDMLIANEKDLASQLYQWKLAPETLEKLARIQDLSSRRYQVSLIKRQVKKILIDSQNLLVATIVPKIDN